MSKVFVIAEIGCNHNGDKLLAKKMVDIAKDCGVDAVKFQTFNSSELISKYAPKADYQKVTTGTDDNQLEMTKKLELSQDDYLELKQYCESKNLVVFSTPFDNKSIEFLEKNGQTIWKIPSGEITNLPYLEKIGSINCKNKEIILSTGMSTIQEIKTAIDILQKNASCEQSITILHCNTEYPTPDCDVNLLSINDIKNNFKNNKIGFSDHSVGYLAAVGAVPLGISMIEKHFTLDKTMPGPDHKASANPKELKELCDNVRRLEKMLGNGVKNVSSSEKKNMKIARKSIVARCEIKKGDTFTNDNITCKRPGNGISPMYWYEVLGRKAEKDFEEDELISVNGINMENYI